MDLYQTLPPYRRYEPVRPGRRRPARGAVTVTVLTASDVTEMRVLDALRAERAATLWAPMVLSLPADNEGIGLARGSALVRLLSDRTGARAVARGGLPDAAGVRRALLRKRDWRSDLVPWCELRFPDLPERTRTALNGVLVHDDARAQLDEPVSDDTLTRWLTAAGLPPRRTWGAIIKVLYNLRACQEKQSLDFRNAIRRAERLYASQASFSSMCSRLTRLPPKKLMRGGMVGWEFPLWKALNRR